MVANRETIARGAVGGSVEEAVVRMICLEGNARKHGGAMRAGVENWGNVVEAFWLFHREEAERTGALAGMHA